MQHSGRAHSKFSASGAERWFNCPGSVALSEGMPDKDNVWSIEGTKAHEVLERILRMCIKIGRECIPAFVLGEKVYPKEMVSHAVSAANFILDLHAENPYSEILVESRIYLKFIHPQMFGTFDGAVLDHFGCLHVLDFKYGTHRVSPESNLQMIFYALGLADLYHWNFDVARLYIIQPRLRGYDGPLVWEIKIDELRKYVKVFREAVERVLAKPDLYIEGPWCHWCKAKSVCPLKNEVRVERARNIFLLNPL